MRSWLQAQGVLTEQEAAQVAHDVLRVLAACHEQGILYADIKPANFLLAQPYPDTRDLIQGIAAQQPIQIRVADFGCATRVIKVRVLPVCTCTWLGGSEPTVVLLSGSQLSPVSCCPPGCSIWAV